MASGKTSVGRIILDKFVMKGMLERLETKYSGDRGKMIKDPIELLKAIRTIMDDSYETEYSFLTRAKTLKRVVNIRMGKDESIGEYARRFRQYCDALEDRMGPLCLGGAELLSTTDYRKADKEKREAMTREYWNTMTGLLFMLGAEGHAYVTMRDEYARSFTDGIDRYPKTVQDAVEKMNQFARTTRRPTTAAAATNVPDPGNNAMTIEKSDAASAVSAITGATFSQQGSTDIIGYRTYLQTVQTV
jgi:hypothetical protein